MACATIVLRVYLSSCLMGGSEWVCFFKHCTECLYADDDRSASACCVAVLIVCVFGAPDYMLHMCVMEELHCVPRIPVCVLII
jgi:hypothetical protein